MLIMITLLLAGCAGSLDSRPARQVERPTEPIATDPEVARTQEVAVNLDNFGAAPELNNEVWLNTDHPLRLADLRGKVVMLDMWTFGWINCQHVIPSLRGWYEEYGSQGLVVIGNHFPEFSYEKELGSLKQAIRRLEVTYPVAQDNDGRTWSAYNNRYWPTMYLIDKRGDIRYKHIGEGHYEETEAAIKALLAEEYP
jgi:thiol-disulfide isomerase/thioredoxin